MTIGMRPKSAPWRGWKMSGKSLMRFGQLEGQAEADEVDALDGQAVNHHADRVLIMSGTLDLSFNLINLGDRQGTPLVDFWCSLSYPRAAESKCQGQLG
jgi:hypothetical protein